MLYIGSDMPSDVEKFIGNRPVGECVLEDEHFESSEYKLKLSEEEERADITTREEKNFRVRMIGQKVPKATKR
jgi:hypothetical protein